MGKKTKNLSKEGIRYLIENYPMTHNEELARKLGVSVWGIKSCAYKHKLRKSPEFISELRSRIAVKHDCTSQLNTPEAIEKRARSYRRTIETEKARINFGIEQKTKLHFRNEPRERLLQRNRLERLGYVIDKDKLIAYYTPETRRAVRLEKLKRGTATKSMRTFYDFRPMPPAK